MLLTIAAGAGALSLWLRQPVLPAYIVVGIVVGPAALGIVSAHDQVNLLAQLGVAVLLFVVGLKLDLQHIRHIGPVALATGLGQLAFTIAFGFLLILLMGKSLIEALYVAIALTFSSTIIIVKLLSDKREIDSLHGRIAVGFLIVQDLAVVLAMMAMSAMRDSAGAPLPELAISLLARIAIVVAAMVILMRRVLPKILSLAARSKELLLIFSIAWGTGLAALGDWAGFSKEAGAFLAGFSLASTPYRDAINARLTGIRDFLLLFFFIDLGARLDFSTLGQALAPAVVLSLFVLIGNPLIVMAIMGYMGYRKRTSFLAGLTVAQISEFSIVFVAMGISLGHVGIDALGLTTLVGLVTIAASTYMILHSHRLYELLAPWLRIFERENPYRELAATAHTDGHERPEVLVFGLGRYGRQLALGLRASGLEVLGIDFDPVVVRAASHQGLPVRFGDGIEVDFIGSLPLGDIKWVVSALPDAESNRGLMQALRENDFQGKVAAVTSEETDAILLGELGASIVLQPLKNAVDHAATALAGMIKNGRAD
ncbi:cation:proton antiporter [Massilia glaciei]|uniref:cation:proton antiporter n=1 Tax=Massilia glaciei TaxID=1524097 RepID=UPI001C62EEF0|nr:cation:proton antiporter family protein [Massilia glaciei]